MGETILATVIVVGVVVIFAIGVKKHVESKRRLEEAKKSSGGQ